MITDQQKRLWLYNLSNLKALSYPFPHAILQNTIPAALYAEMLSNLPPHEEFVPLHTTGRIGKGAYPQRFVYDPDSDRRALGNMDADRQEEFWHFIREFLLTTDFGLALARPFGKLADQLERNPAAWAMDSLLIEDLPQYRIGPHADASHKVLSALFYLSQEPTIEVVDHTTGEVTTNAVPAWGTSIYMPKPEAVVDPQSGRHYEFEQFDLIATIPYAWNSGLMFLKSDKSWHGVEQIPAIPGLRRLILLADIKLPK